MTLRRQNAPLEMVELSPRLLQAGQLRIAVSACGVCRTDLHVVDGDLKNPKLPIIPGHEIVGRIVAVAPGVKGFNPGDRVGVPWLGWTCGTCAFCLEGKENLCSLARFTGYHIDGGFASETTADSRYVFPLPQTYSDESAAPLMCAGLIGWRSLTAVGKAARLGLYGFGAAAHILVQVAKHRGQEIFAFVRPGDEKAKTFALTLGAVWAGYSGETPPVILDAAILFAPAGELVPMALRAIRPGGTVVCGGIHMTDIPSFPYSILWGERTVRSIANLTRRDAEEFLAFVARNIIHTTTVPYPLKEANRALSDLREGSLTGAAVIIP
jgi:propanol-preferring alcohol dehydrogenase